MYARRSLRVIDAESHVSFLIKKICVFAMKSDVCYVGIEIIAIIYTVSV